MYCPKLAGGSGPCVGGGGGGGAVKVEYVLVGGVMGTGRREGTCHW